MQTNKLNYTREQMIKADGYAYYMAGSSPCEDCKNNTHRNLYLLHICQNDCEEFQNYNKDYSNYFSDFIKRNVTK